MPIKRLWFVLLGLFLLAACQPGNIPSSSAPAETPASEGITVTDALGRTLHLRALPQRIVVAGRANVLVADALYAFPEAPERVVALVDQGQTSSAADFLRLLDPDLDAKLTLGVDAGPEQIAAQQPDLVVMKQFMAEKLGKSVEALGIPVFYVQMETPEQYQRELRALGTLFGNPARAEELAAFYREKTALVQEAVANAGDERPRVLVLQRTLKGGATAYKVPAPQWLQTSLVRLGGGEPVWVDDIAGGGWSVVSMEQIAAWNPDQIFIVDYFDDPVAAARAFSAGGTARQLQAVQQGRVMPFPKDFVSWDQPDTRWVLGLLWLAKQMQPEAMAALDMQAEVETFYRSVYGLDDTALQTLWQRVMPFVTQP